MIQGVNSEIDPNCLLLARKTTVAKFMTSCEMQFIELDASVVHNEPPVNCLRKVGTNRQ